MKMKPKDYAQLEQAIRKVQADYPDITAEHYRKLDMTAMRFRWDMLNVAVSRDYFPRRATCDAGSLYDYCNDDHIDTALRRITGTK
jgi:hypothetical protein